VKGVVLIALCTAPTLVEAQEAPASPAATTLTLGEAIELALTRSFAMRTNQQDLEIARGQIDEAWGSVYPQVDLTARYVRTIETPSPFAGSDADGLFGSFAVIPWLAYNEGARQGGGMPLSLEDYFAGCADGSLPPEAGCSNDTGGGGNPFLIPNQATLTLAISQVLYSGRAFAAIDAAESFEAQQLDTLRQESLTVAADVARAYHRAQLARAQVEVLRKSSARIKETLAEITKRVEQGVLPQFQQLSMEVEAANLDSQLLQVETGAEDAVDALKLTIGLPVEESIALRTPLTAPSGPIELDSVDAAMQRAERQRADLARLQHTRKLLVAQKKLVDAENLPTVSAFANAGLQGTLPDDPDVGPFSSDYWGPSLNAGVQLTWNLFAGRATDARQRQRQAEVDKFDVQSEQARQGVRLEITRAIRAVDSARRRLEVQSRVVERAELNFRHAEVRVKEGVSTGIEVREASQQLDESRANHLQAVHDLLLAHIEYQVAIGTPPAELRGAGRSAAPSEAP